MNLYELNINKIATISEINIDTKLKRRLMDLGLVKGTKIRLMFKGIFGNPRAYEVRGSLIALRNEDAKRIIIKN